MMIELWEMRKEEAYGKEEGTKQQIRKETTVVISQTTITTNGKGNNRTTQGRSKTSTIDVEGLIIETNNINGGSRGSIYSKPI